MSRVQIEQQRWRRSRPHLFYRSTVVVFAIGVPVASGFLRFGISRAWTLYLPVLVALALAWAGLFLSRKGRGRGSLACALGVGGLVPYLVFYHQPWFWVFGRGFFWPSHATQLRLGVGWLGLLIGLATIAKVLAWAEAQSGQTGLNVAGRLWSSALVALFGLSLLDHDSWYVVGVVGLIALGDVAVRRRKRAAAAVLGVLLFAVVVASLLALAALVAFGCAYQGSCGWSAGEILRFWATPAALAALLIFDAAYLMVANRRRVPMTSHIPGSPATTAPYPGRP